MRRERERVVKRAVDLEKCKGNEYLRFTWVESVQVGYEQGPMKAIIRFRLVTLPLSIRDL